jgi:hypothetical protein
MSTSFSSHEFFIEQGAAFRVEVEPHNYTRDHRPEKEFELENARILISSGDFEWSIEISIPKDALRQLVRIAEKYLKDGEGDSFFFGCE